MLGHGQLFCSARRSVLRRETWLEERIEYVHDHHLLHADILFQVLGLLSCVPSRRTQGLFLLQTLLRVVLVPIHKIFRPKKIIKYSRKLQLTKTIPSAFRESKMKVNVKVRGEWLLIPVKAVDFTVQKLGDIALCRYRSLKGYDVDNTDAVVEVRKPPGGSLLFPEDLVEDLVEDGGFLYTVLKSDQDSESFTPTSTLQHEVHTTSKFAKESMSLDGYGLSTEDLVKLGEGNHNLKLTDKAWEKVTAARELLDNIVKENKVVYGVTTGFGKFARVVIPPEKLNELQENLIRSHAAGVGPPLTPERTRRLLALRINVIAKGHSGLAPKNLKSMLDAFNASCLPWVPEKGTVGASGDLAPLSHLALGMMGEGKMWSPRTGWSEAEKVLKMHGVEPIVLGPKEGLALINGTQLITSLGAEAVLRAANIARQADVVAALTLDVLKGTNSAFESHIHSARPHKGQMKVARNLRSLLASDVHPSEISESHRFCDRVQDAYTLRCCPQVHGIVNDTIDFVQGILTTEMNSATDNPMVFADRKETISGGNFHGEYPAKVLDYLAIGVHELAAISERRTERLVNPSLSELPAFLVEEGGLNSGFMVAHCTAAALVSENKVLTHPASVDSLPTSANQEDHVSMGGFSARKCLQVVEHVEQVLAIELLAACQGIEFLRPLKTTAPLEEVYKLVREVVAPWDKDRYIAPDIEAATKLLQEEKVWKVVKPYMDHYHTEHLKDISVRSPTASVLGSGSDGPKPKRKRMAKH